MKDALMKLGIVDVRRALPYGARAPIGSSDRRRSATLHYSGVAVKQSLDDLVMLEALRNEARFHIGKEWGRNRDGSPIRGDGLMYHLTVAPSGTIWLCRNLDAVLYHAANTTANTTSLAVHLMLGPDQAPTPRQWQRTCDLFDALIAAFRWTPAAKSIFGHRDWPRSDGKGQSSCPGDLLHRLLRDYQHAGQPPAVSTWRVRPAFDFGAIRIGPSTDYAKAFRDTATMPPGQPFLVRAIVNDETRPGRRWLHLDSELGFVSADICEQVVDPAPPAGVWRVQARYGAGSIRIGPSTRYPKALDDTAVMPAGHAFRVRAIHTDMHGHARRWLHLESELGFIADDICEQVP